MDSFGTDNFSRLSRYESGLDRAFYRASKELEALQKTRIGFARQNREQESAPAPTPINEPRRPAATSAPAPTPINKPREAAATSASAHIPINEPRLTPQA